MAGNMNAYEIELKAIMFELSVLSKKLMELNLRTFKLDLALRVSENKGIKNFCLLYTSPSPRDRS